MTTIHATPEKVDTLFGESVDFVSYCKANGYRTPKHTKKKTQDLRLKSKIYTPYLMTKSRRWCVLALTVTQGRYISIS